MRLDPVTFELLRNYLQAIVEEMAQVVRRTAHTTFVKEISDFATGLLTPDGEFFAFPLDVGVSSFVGLNYAKTLEAVGALEDGDIVLTNDPYSTAGAVTHLPDVHTLKPIYWQGRLVCFTYAFLHLTDIGGSVPASVSPRSVEVFQEGLRIPPKKLFRGEVLNQDLVDMIRANCRIPDQSWGDLKALVAALNSGARRVHETIRKFGLDVLDKGMQDLIEYTEQKVRTIIARIPDGRYEFVDYLEDDVASETPVRLQVAMTIRGRDVELDFAGTDSQVDAALNVPTAGRHPFLAVALINYFVSTDLTMPLNVGLLRPIRMTVPPGSIVNCVFPAACGLRYATIFRVYDTLMGALAKAVPDEVPAAGGGQSTVVHVSLPDVKHARRHVSIVEPVIGGGGGLAGQDGVNGCDPSVGFLRTSPVETLETEIPIVVRRYHLVPGSAGAGRARGGFGLRLDVQTLRPGAVFTIRGMERFRFQPWGVRGGRAGACGGILLNPDSPREQRLGKVDYLVLQPGDVLSVRSPGSGGYGDPLQRPPDRVQEDVAAGLLSRDAARECYGVVMDDIAVDVQATEALRKARQQNQVRTDFDFGPARAAHERVWTADLYESLHAILHALPIPYRSLVRRKLYEAVRARAESGAAVTAADLHSAWGAVRDSLRA